MFTAPQPRSFAAYFAVYVGLYSWTAAGFRTRAAESPAWQHSLVDLARPDITCGRAVKRAWAVGVNCCNPHLPSSVENLCRQRIPSHRTAEALEAASLPVDRLTLRELPKSQHYVTVSVTSVTLTAIAAPFHRRQCHLYGRGSRDLRAQ